MQSLWHSQELDYRATFLCLSNQCNHNLFCFILDIIEKTALQLTSLWCFGVVEYLSVFMKNTTCELASGMLLQLL